MCLFSAEPDWPSWWVPKENDNRTSRETSALPSPDPYGGAGPSAFLQGGQLRALLIWPRFYRTASLSQYL